MIDGGNRWTFPSYSPRKRPEWRIREPEDQSDAVPHVRAEEVTVPGEFRFIGASIRGKKHAHYGAWREDDFDFAGMGSCFIMAVADGAGSCGHSRIGAGAACRGSVRYLLESLETGGIPGGKDRKELMVSAVVHARNAVESISNTRRIDLDRLSTTLILVWVIRGKAETELLTLQVGDGAVCVATTLGRVVVLGRPHTFGRYAGESAFLITPGISETFQERVMRMAVPEFRHLAVMTDGISDDFYPLDTGLALLFQQLEASVLFQDQPLEALQHWLAYEKTGSFDDRTLLVLSRQRGESIV